MAWEQLNAVILSGNTYNLPKLTSTAFTWACNNYNILTGTKKKDFTSDVRDGSQGDAPFRLTSYSQITTYNNQTFSFANNNDNFLFWAYTGSQVTPVMTGTIGSNSTNVQVDNFPNNGDAYPICYGFAIDRDNEIAFMWAASKNGYDSMYGVYIMSVGTTETRHLLYNDLMANQPVLYQWSSVPTISGKNGILTLTEILNINDGNAVNGVALSGNISLSSSSRISAIISGIIQNEGSATVKYSVPSNIYSYIKLVYKQDKIPTSVNDGTAVDLDPTATSIDVMGFSKTVGTKYYLVIFTDKSTSDEYSYEVGNPPPRFSIPKKFVSDNGTFNYNIPSWIEDRVLSVLESDPTTTTIYFDVENYPAVANLYSHQFVEYPLQFRTHYGTYPEGGSRPTTSSYIAKDYKLEWMWTNGNLYRDETDYLKTNGEWVSVYTQGSGRSRADNNFESFVAEMFILDHIEKKGYPAYFSWAHSENWSGRKYQCQITKMGTGSRYEDLATAIYNALK